MASQTTAPIKERPILFSAPMVTALRENRKTQTRRTRGLGAINKEPDAWKLIAPGMDNDFAQFDSLLAPGEFGFRKGGDISDPDSEFVRIRCPYGVAGDRLWTREAFTVVQGPAYGSGQSDEVVLFACDMPDQDKKYLKWKPSIHMPRAFSRDTLEVVSARPERLQDITEADAIAEGCESSEISPAQVADFQISDHAPQLKELSRKLGAGTFTAKLDFMMLWDDINGPGAWAKNPWVWRVEFRRV